MQDRTPETLERPHEIGGPGYWVVPSERTWCAGLRGTRGIAAGGDGRGGYRLI